MSLKMKIYRTLTGSTVRKIVKGVDDFCANNLPTVRKRILLPLKAGAKGVLLKFSMSRGKNSGQAPKLWKIATRENFSPMVSIIVPNYNHARYLRRRLETIYAQTYKNFEVILLDDASTDSSRDILQEFQELHTDNTRLLCNAENSGAVFNQWRKGLEAARGDLIWIAESDDYSAENFLAELVKPFADDAIQLAFCRSDFVEEGQKVFTTEQYLSDLQNLDFTKNFAMTAADFVCQGFGVKNIIPNVSSVIFRRPQNIRDQVAELWRDMKLCGDWAFYLDIIKGGCVYYSAQVTNFYRVHKDSTSLKIQRTPQYFAEHQRIAEFIAENYNVSFELHKAHLRLLESHFFGYYGGKDILELRRLFDVGRILRVNRKPNILMGVFAFSIGGGETFPVTLANELSRKGFAVTVLNFRMADDLPDIRKKLNSTVPMIDINNTGGLAEVCAQFKIDIIHTHHGATDSAAAFVAENSKSLSHVVTLHGMYDAADTNYLKKILSCVKNSVSVFVYIADKNLIPFKENNFGHENIFVKVGNGLERIPINPVPRSDLNIPENSFVACIVSRAIPQKGWQAAIDAVTLANEKSERRIDLILVGAGEMYDKLYGHVPDFIHLVGFKSNVRDYLATADIGLLPSEYAGESFPLLIIDSFFANRPVVSSDIGEVSAMIEDAGIVFDLVDGKVPVEKLAEILTALANNPDNYAKISNRVNNVAEKFSIERVANKYISIYNKVLVESH
ncbi:MAG: glycosyltransferase [Selenomonadaceae bacterium]|nr:glycosyltransferase [Selenomonadaceae bacterium]